MLHEDAHTEARVGKLKTLHGEVDTPAYMPVGTHGAVRCLTPDQVQATGSQMILANTYHLHLRPGEEIVNDLGGLHEFMGWSGPILTDSGGFQVFSLSDWNKMEESGVTFKSPIDGKKIELTPEKAIQIQNVLGADVIMAFDHCPPYPATEEEVADAVARTTRWTERSKNAHSRPDVQSLFGIVQGGVFEDLRQRSVEELLPMDFPGYAIGGVSVGEPPEDMHRIAAFTAPLLPKDKPRYLMGIGVDRDLLAGIRAGVDLFDCVLATRNARNSHLFSRTGTIRIKNQQYERDTNPIDEHCSCYTCKNFSLGYLRHLYARRETLAGTLGSIHNIHFLQDLMLAARQMIQLGEFETFHDNYPESFRDWRRESF